jgi:YVTN family beta-propeller protein
MGRRISLGLVLGALLIVSYGSRASDKSIPYGKRSSSAIAITNDGATLLVVNPDSNSLTLVNTADRSILAEIPVGTDPRTVTVDDAGQRAYVANRGSGSVSVVDLATSQTITEVHVGSRPYGLVVSPSGGTLYVSDQGLHRLVTLDTASLEMVSSRPLASRPSGLGLSPDGETLLVTHLLSSRITVVPARAHTLYLPIIARGRYSRTFLHDRAGGLDRPISGYGFAVSTVSLFPDSNLVQSVVFSPEGSTAYIPHTRSNSNNLALTFDTTVFPMVSLVDLSTGQHLLGQQIDLGTVDPPGVGLPFDAALAPDGSEIWIVNAASNDLSVVDLTQQQLIAHIEVGHNPRGIVLSPGGETAYVNNTLAGTVSVVDAKAYVVTDIITVTQIPLPPALLNGKRLFHTSDDPRLAKNQWVACNSCHFEGEHDGRTWTFAFSGPRNTTGLLGMIDTYPLRWSGEWDESADSEFANRKENFGSGLVEGEMNCTLSPPDCVHQPPNQGRSYDLDSLALFLDSLAVSPSPTHANGEPLTDAELRGKAIFLDPTLGCVACHPPPLYTDQQRHDVGTATHDEHIGPDYDTPSLRGLYDSAPYFHDGSAATLLGTLTRPSSGSEHDVRSRLADEQIQDLIAFLLALPYQ